MLEWEWNWWDVCRAPLYPSSSQGWDEDEHGGMEMKVMGWKLTPTSGAFRKFKDSCLSFPSFQHPWSIATRLRACLKNATLINDYFNEVKAHQWLWKPRGFWKAPRWALWGWLRDPLWHHRGGWGGPASFPASGNVQVKNKILKEPLKHCEETKNPGADGAAGAALPSQGEVRAELIGRENS